MNFMKLNIQLFAASLSISAYETDVSIENNTSYIQLSISATTSGQTYNNAGTAYVNCDLVGQNNSISIPTTHFTIGKTTTKVIYSGKIGPFTHNTDGSLNPVVINASSYLSPSFSPSASTSCAMSTIARKSTFNVSNAVIGGACNININRAANFTHTLLYSFGNLSGTIATGVATNYGWVIPTSFYNQIPNSKSGTCTITCVTYNGNVEIGRTSQNIIINCDELLCKPDVGGTIVDINEKTISLTGNSSNLIKYKSIAKVTGSGVAKNGATVKSILIDGFTSPLVSSGVSKNSFTITVIDSRDISNSKVISTSMIDYIPLTCKAEFKRKTQTSDIVLFNYEGNYFSGSFGTVNNELIAKWKARLKGDSTWTYEGSIDPTINGNTFSGIDSCDQEFDYKKAYEFTICYSDKLDSFDTGIIQVSKGNGSLEIYDEALVSNGETLFHWENGKINPGAWANFYPVGSIYLSVNNINPSAYFGGEWERFSNGRVLVGVDESQTEFNLVKKIGGHKGLQSHSHSFNGATSTADLQGTLGEVYSGQNVSASGIVTGKTDSSYRQYSNAGTTGNAWSTWNINASHNHSFSGATSVAGDGNTGNLQPYVTCYIWLRIA